jgi:hypothetical protein
LPRPPTTAPGAAAAARSLIEATTRAAVVARARAALTEHLGPLDGLASERAAALMIELAQSCGAA